MKSAELEEKYADYFFEKGDGLPTNLKYYCLPGESVENFTLAFPTGREDETGDVTIEPFTSIFAQVRNFRENEGAEIEVTITTAQRFSPGTEDDDYEIGAVLGGGDDSWRHDFYLFVTFLA